MIKRLALIVSAMALSPSALAAGIDSRTYSCANLQALIVAKGFVFLNNPDFEDFVVAKASYCTGSDQLQLRSVATTDRAQCLVNYCVPAYSTGGN